MAEYARATGLKLNGVKSAYLSAQCDIGEVPTDGPTLEGEWVGGCDGHFNPAREGERRRAGEVAPKGWDEAVRTLGVWRAASGKVGAQRDVLLAAVEEVRNKLAGKHLTVAQAKYVVNAVLVPRLTYPLRDASLTGRKGKGVSEVDAKVRTVFREAVAAVSSLSNAILYADEKGGGVGLASVRGRLDADVIGRLQRCLLEPRARGYWRGRSAQEGGEVDAEGARRARTAGLAHDVAHVMRLEYLAAKKWTGTASPWTGHKVPKAFSHRRAGQIDVRLAARRWALESRGNRTGTALWRALPEDSREALVPVLARRGFHYVGDVATKDGGRMLTWRQLQVEGRVAVGHDEQRWFEATRRRLCLGEGQVLRAELRVPPRALEVGDFVVLPWGGDNTFVRGRGEGVHRVARVTELGGAEGREGQVRVETWDFKEDGGAVRPYHKSRRVETEWKKETGCCWVEGWRTSWLDGVGNHGQEAYVYVGEEEWDYVGAWDRDRERGDADSDDEGGEEEGPPGGLGDFEGKAACDGSFYEAGGLAGYAAVLWRQVEGGGWDRKLWRGALRNGGCRSTRTTTAGRRRRPG